VTRTDDRDGGFEAFQARVLRAATLVACGTLAVAAAAEGGYSPIAGGLGAGFAASLAGHAIRVRTLRRLGRTPAARRRQGLATLGGLARMGCYAAALAAGAFAAPVDLWAAVVGLFLTNAVTVVVAVGDARRPECQS
jgi:hypothetical protein